MTLIGLVVTLVVVGVALYVLNTFLPIDPRIRTLIVVVLAIAVCLWLLEAVGIISTAHLGGRLR